jgi:hypothetical protein
MPCLGGGDKVRRAGEKAGARARRNGLLGENSVAFVIYATRSAFHNGGFSHSGNP